MSNAAIIILEIDYMKPNINSHLGGTNIIFANYT